MRTDRSSSARRPLTVNGSLLDRLVSLNEEIQQSTVEAIARRYSVDKDVLVEALRGDLDRAAPDALPDYTVSREVLDQELRDHEARRKLSRACIELRAYSKYSIGISFESGTTITVDAFDQLVRVLDTEPDKIKSVSFRCGSYGEGTAFTITLRNMIETWSYSVFGEDRKSVEYYSNSLSALLNSSTPDYYYLHSSKTQYLIAIIGGLIANMSVGSIAAGSLKPSEPPSLTSLLSFGLPMLLAQFATFFIVLALLENAFPRCTFEYGHNWKKQKVRMVILGVVLTALLIPLLFEIF
jgi:hypothetical protein